MSAAPPGAPDGGPAAIDQTARRPSRTNDSRSALHLPLALTAALGLLSLLPRVRSNPTLQTSFWAAVGVLLVWQVVLQLSLWQRGEGRSFKILLRPQHYIQAMCQVAVYAYWGWYWRPVYDMVGLIAAQLAFAYAFDMLLAWTRRREYALGFGPFPIILSINLFLWFRDDWFYLQFLMIAIGFLGKELVCWEREGRRVHIFNPSAFALGLFSLVLIATNTTDLTWGIEIASTLKLAPWIYTYLFLVGLVVMYYFSITLVAGTAAAVLFAGSALYAAVTGVPYFLDADIPAAVFLGLLLLITDPSTSPRSPPGKVIFGALYGLGVFALYAILESVGAPGFYDKLLCVPLLNLSVRGIDAVVTTLKGGGAWDRVRLDWIFARPNTAHMSVWIVLFLTMTALGKTDGRHPGDSVPFWQGACVAGRRNACDRLVLLESAYCGDDSAWACNEVGVAYTDGTDTLPDHDRAVTYYARGCDLGSLAACLNLLEPGGAVRADPSASDLRLLLREEGERLRGEPDRELYARACDDGWSFACDRPTVTP